MPKQRIDYESLTVDVDGTAYTGEVTIRDVGLGKVMFDIYFRGKCHEDKSCFRRGDVQVGGWAKIELAKLVRASLAEHPREGAA